MATEVKKCICQHSEQDKLYGKSNRLMNPSNKGFRCTVCGKEHTDSVKK